MMEIERYPSTSADQLWRAHAADLMRFATVLVGPVDAHDITVEAFLRAAPALDGDTVTNPRAYLMRAVANHANDLHRSRERRWRRDLSAVGPASTVGPDSFLDVRRAVSSLSLAQRTVIYFVYWEDLSERDIATLLQVAPGTVRRHLVRARTHLRKALK
jgi:RNA polymerase sigma-70 factor (ECF subfamily)